MRVAKANKVFTSPLSWPKPRIIVHGGTKRPWDSGNANAVASGKKHFITYYTGDSINCKVVVATNGIRYAVLFGPIQKGHLRTEPKTALARTCPRFNPWSYTFS